MFISANVKTHIKLANTDDKDRRWCSVNSGTNN